MKLCILWSCNITLGWFRNCRGDSNIKCGGIWKMQVYRIPTVNEAGLIPGETVVHGWQRLLTQRLHEFQTRGTERMVFTHPSNILSHGVKSFCFNPIKRLCKSRARDLTDEGWLGIHLTLIRNSNAFKLFSSFVTDSPCSSCESSSSSRKISMRIVHETLSFQFVPQSHIGRWVTGSSSRTRYTGLELIVWIVVRRSMIATIWGK